VWDLIWVKSPALVATHLMIVAAILFPGLCLGSTTVTSFQPLQFVISLNLTLFYAVVAQLIVFLRTQKQGLWVTGTGL